MNKIEKGVQFVLSWGTVFSTCAFIGSVLLQIFSRFFLDQAPSWTEEASRIFFVYATAFAAGLALKDGEFIAFEGMFNRLSPTVQKALNTFIPLLICLLFGLFGYFSLPFIIQGYSETSPSMGVPMAVAFFSMLLLAIGICFYALLPFFSTAHSEKP